MLNTKDVVGYLRCKGQIGGMTMSISGYGYRLADIDGTPLFDEMFNRDSTMVSSVVFGQEGNFLLFVSVLLEVNFLDVTIETEEQDDDRNG